MRKKLIFFLFLVTIGIVAGVFLFQDYNAPESAPAVMVKCGPTPPWIEVYHDGELTSE